MSQSIDVLHQTMLNKFNALELAGKIGDNEIATNCGQLRNKYSAGVVTYICEYFRAASDKKQKIVTQYMRFIVGDNYVGIMNSWYQRLSNADQKMSNPKVQELGAALKSYVQANLDMKPVKIDYKICPSCGGKMTIYPHTSEMICSNVECGLILELKGTVFDDTQFYSGGSEGQSSIPKRGRHETNKHCIYHLDRILALKAMVIPKGLDEKIDKWITDNNITILRGLTCETFRRCFKDIKETRYNEYIPYIRQQKTGVSPANLTHTEKSQVYIYFDKAVQAIPQIMGVKGGNMKYYPFFIAKILELILCKPSDRSRLQSIIDCIHFQRDDTIVQNDKIWESICNHVPEFRGKFKKTDKNMLQIS